MSAIELGNSLFEDETQNEQSFHVTRVEVKAADHFILRAIISLVKPKSNAKAFERLTAKRPARMVSMVTGKASIIYHGTFRGPDELAHFITDEIGALSGIQSIDTCVDLNGLRRYWMDRD
ncbi:Lrp/AsnC ligand binding domain-containing protein [Arthrobacter sp. CAN_C5]|uniref:Lrp/AsnC ligand binding domain-containing protein n=1 Tax=Arthrobacter sp. CAN_C5 TaxID=2760706 RepID=UPI001AE8A80D|nr:Lrp/AsnC ligand binding domain-containing protein [Arthrobacter sp. CAN_C5]MBP2218041.1 hypothetical protein [Arthrobacter sp. CAN_C5]